MRLSYPAFTVSDAELREGLLAYVGTLNIDLGATVESNHVLLVYDEQTPFAFPRLYPLSELPSDVEWTVDDVIRKHCRRMPQAYRRHQMSDQNSPSGAGMLCLIESQSHNSVDDVTGVTVLRRAHAVFTAIALGRPFPFADSEEDDLEAHFPRYGDILLGDAFFDTGLGRRGTFWATPTFDAMKGSPAFVHQEISFPRTLYVGLHLTSDSDALIGSWRTDKTNALLNAFPFLDHLSLDLEDIATKESRSPFGGIEGVWFELDAEPEPPLNGSELVEVLERHGSLADGTYALLKGTRFGEEGEKVMHVALRYPGRDGAPAWLFVRVVAEETLTKTILQSEGEVVRREFLRGAKILGLRTHRIAQPALQLRNRGTVPDSLRGKSVLVLGCGALGGDVAVTLAKAGVGRLALVDPDWLVPGNAVRHVAGIEATGLAKPDALRHLVHQHNPYVAVDAEPRSATQPRSTIDDLLSQYDLAVCTIADEAIELVINEAATRLDRTVIYGRALRSGTCGRVFRVRPNQDACKACLAIHRTSPDLPTPQYIDIPPAADELIARECGHPILSGSAVDLRIVADFTARAVLDELGERADWNNLVWVREPWDEAPESVSTPYSVVRETFAPHPRCPVCKRPRISKIVMKETAAATMRNHAESKPQVETGGVLIGYEDEGVVTIVEVTDAGPNAEETKTRFRYDADYANEKLANAASRLGKRGLYVGEWHTHLERHPRPSARDVESLTDIALSPTFLADEPIMIIAGVDPADGRLVGTYASSFPIGRSMRELPLVGL